MRDGSVSSAPFLHQITEECSGIYSSAKGLEVVHLEDAQREPIRVSFNGQHHTRSVRGREAKWHLGSRQ